MSTIATSDGVAPTVDTTLATVDQGFDGLYPPGWPCASLGLAPPSVADLQSAPTPESLLLQVLALAPRGPAWGTDEVGDGAGASPMLRRFWTALAAWSAGNNAREWTLATQGLPSAIDAGLSLVDWEAELGLPDSCFSGASSAAARIAAVRARFGAQGGQSPAYFICLAASLGYTITIEEPTQFLIDVSEVGPDPVAEDWFRIDDGEAAPDSVVGGALQPEGDGTRLESFAMLPLDAATAAALDEVCDETAWKYWIVHVSSLGETWFYVDEGEVAPDSIVDGVLQPEGTGDPLEGFLTAADLECVLRRYAPQHTVLIFSYALV